MKIQFYKYQGTGNDFVMIDGREKDITLNSAQIAAICDRRFGIGADGVIILRNHPDYDFEMDYYNADASKSFCGNGSRCAQAFARQLGMIDETSYFLAIDGAHEGKRMGEDFATKMKDVDKVRQIASDFYINTGSPHYIQYVPDVEQVDVMKEGQKIRYNATYREEGTNVNFVSEGVEALEVRTYERGVEGETYSCGTGVTAVAISYLVKHNSEQEELPIVTKGGNLRIQLQRIAEEHFTNIWLIGPARFVFEGEWEA